MAGQDQTDLHHYSLKSNKNLLQLIFQLALQMGHCHAVAFLPNSPTGREKLICWAFSVLMQFPKLFTWFSYTSNLSEISPQAIGMQISSKRSTRPYSHFALQQLPTLLSLSGTRGKFSALFVLLLLLVCFCVRLQLVTFWMMLNTGGQLRQTGSSVSVGLAVSSMAGIGWQWWLVWL